MSNGEAYQVLNDIIIPGFNYFLDNFGQEFLNKAGIPSIGGKRTNDPGEDFKEHIGKLLDNLQVLLDCIRRSPQFSTRNPINQQTAGEYLTDSGKLKELFVSLAPATSDPQPIIHDRQKLEKYCQAKEQFVLSGKARPGVDPMRQRAELIYLAYQVFGFRPSSAPPGNGTFDPQSQTLELAFFLQVLAYLATNRHNFIDAAQTGSIPPALEQDLQAAAREKGFCADAVKLLPLLGLLLVKPDDPYKLKPVINFRVQAVRHGTISLRWELPKERCDQIMLERKCVSDKQIQPDILIGKKRTTEFKDDLRNHSGEEFEYRVRSIWKQTVAKDGPKKTIWISDEPKITKLKLGDAGIIIEWQPARNCQHTLIFRRLGHQASVTNGKADNNNTKLITCVNSNEKNYQDDLEIRPGTTYYYLFVAEYPGGIYSAGVLDHITTPRHPDSPRKVEAQYHFDPTAGDNRVSIRIIPGPDSNGAKYKVIRYQYYNKKKDISTEKVIQPGMKSLSFVDQEADPGTCYIYHIIPMRQGLHGKGVDSDAIPIVPGVWNLNVVRGDRRIEFHYQSHKSVTEVVIRRNGIKLNAQKTYASDSGLVNGNEYNYLVACRYKFKDGIEHWSEGQPRTGLKPRVPPEAVRLTPRIEKDKIICALGNPRSGILRVFRVKKPPLYRYGAKVDEIGTLGRLGEEIPVSEMVATDAQPTPREPYYMVFTIDVDDQCALAGECRKCAYVPDVEDLKWFLVEGGIRLRWRWPDSCNTAVVLLKKGSYPDDPSVERDDRNNITWKYRDETLNLIERAAYTEDGDSCFLPIDSTSGDWHVKVHVVVHDIASSGENEGCKSIIPSHGRTRLDYHVYRRRRKLLLDWCVDPPCEPFKFLVIGSDAGVPTDTKFGQKVFPSDSEEEWPDPDNKGVRRWSRDIPLQYDEKDVYCRLFIDSSEPWSAFISVRHPKDMLSPIGKKAILRGNRVWQPRISSRYRLTRQKRILCPYCFEKFRWWQVLFRDYQGQERPVVWWRRILAAILIWRGAPSSVLRAPGTMKVCPMHCRKAREQRGRVIDLDNRLFLWPSLHLGLMGTVRAGKSHWVFSASRRLISFGLTAIDAQTNKRLEEMYDTVVHMKAPLDRTQPPPPEAIAAPLLFEASWNHGNRRMVLSLCDVDGETWEKFGEVAKKAHMRYLHTSQGLVFIVDPLQITGVRRMLGSSLPEDAPKNEECKAQSKPIDNLVDALTEAGATPKFKTPIAVVISKTDVLREKEPLLRESLWDTPSYHPGGKTPAYSIGLHWNVQFAAREFLRRYDLELVNKIENSFENFAYFCVAPTGCAVKKEGEYQKFARFAPWRVEEPILWLFSRLGVIPSS